MKKANNGGFCTTFLATAFHRESLSVNKLRSRDEKSSEKDFYVFKIKLHVSWNVIVYSLYCFCLRFFCPFEHKYMAGCTALHQAGFGVRWFKTFFYNLWVHESCFSSTNPKSCKFNEFHVSHEPPAILAIYVGVGVAFSHHHLIFHVVSSRTIELSYLFVTLLLIEVILHVMRVLREKEKEIFRFRSLSLPQHSFESQSISNKRNVCMKSMHEWEKANQHHS
ncbi:CLUMA_CG008218, isoform A [Clunio marinus]|uniref:CLUMA_CG008218, isoform A n=1 Tax=Clunio marinus TaxID=568069 RepID=A0A1J1I6Y8_9DIPT|nr:CLUMA_CG008218, isoform A [Clunio marinus]